MIVSNYQDRRNLEKAAKRERMKKTAHKKIFVAHAEPVDDVNAALAIKYYKAAAAAGRKEAMLDLGAAYMDGASVKFL